MQRFLFLANQHDSDDALKNFRSKFYFPSNKTGEEKIYLCGHSLGLQPKQTENFIKEELKEWASLGVEGHFTSKKPWLNYHETVTEQLANIAGAKVSETIAMNALTVNLHLMLVSFYCPTKTRFKILIESGAFPSDRYAVHSHLRWHGQDITEAFMEIPTNEKGIIGLEALEKILAEQGERIALVLLPGVQYKTGQALPIEKITELVHKQGAIVGWDLAHAIGNIPLELHQWNCDFAVWCHYKYLNAGPGAIGGCFVHERHLQEIERVRFAGWWGHDKFSRFEMPEYFQPIKTVEAWQISNPPIFQLAALRASLELFAAANMEKLREKSLQLFRYSEQMINELLANDFEVLTPLKSAEHGAQLSIKLKNSDPEMLMNFLQENNIVCDIRRPNIIRFAAVPLYNTFFDVYRFIELLYKFTSKKRK